MGHAFPSFYLFNVNTKIVGKVNVNQQQNEWKQKTFETKELETISHLTSGTGEQIFEYGKKLKLWKLVSLI